MAAKVLRVQEDNLAIGGARSQGCSRSTGRLLGAVAGAGVLLALVLSPAGRAESAPTDVSVAANARISGVDLQTYNDTSMQPLFPKIAADGANMVNITVWWEVPSSSSNTIEPDYSGPTISDADLMALARRAQAAGLKVSLTPDFEVGNNEWRGSYNPPDPSTFFNNYTAMVVHYAQIAQQLGMPMFWVGSEMVDSEQYTSEWESLIAAVRQVYSGQLLYECNWATLSTVQFYRSLNAMSISAYFPLSTAADPSLQDLLDGWSSYSGPPFSGHWVSDVESAAARWQEPVYFGEAGYSYSTYAAAQPWNESYDTSDPDLQYRCYQSLLDTFSGFSWWGGVTWWTWDGGVYNMDGEPAEALIGTKSVSYPPPPTSSPGTSPGSPGSSGHGGSSPSGTPSSSAGRGPAGSSPSSNGGSTPPSVSAGQPGAAGGTAGGKASSRTNQSTAAKGAAAKATPSAQAEASGQPGGSAKRASSAAGIPIVAAGLGILALLIGGIAVAKRDWLRKRLSSAA